MIKAITIGDITYEVLEKSVYSKDEELLFQIRKDGKNEYVLGFWDEMLGQPVRKIWRIVGILKKD